MGEAQAEALVRKKPRRTLHNQLLIQIVAVLACYSGLVLPFIGFWLVFGVCPSIVVPVLVVLWGASATTYATLKLYVARENKKPLSPKGQ